MRASRSRRREAPCSTVLISQAGDGAERRNQALLKFKCASGRLKLRVFKDGTGELIFYRRGDSQGPKESFFIRTPASDPDSLRDALSLAYGQVGRVKKQRTLYFVGRTRVHLDQVEGLGHFMEVEVVLAHGESLDDGTGEAEQLMATLGIARSSLVEGAYMDLLAARPEHMKAT